MKILAVDDEKDTLRLLREILETAGHHVTTAASATEAMVHVRVSRFDLVLLDIMMPGQDGHQFAHFMSTDWKLFDVPIIVISCRTDAESKSWAKLNGCVGYIEKPFSPGDVLDAVSAVEERRADVRDSPRL